MTFNNIIENSIHAVVLQEKKKKKHVHSPFSKRVNYTTLEEAKEKSSIEEFEHEIEQSKSSKAFTSDIVDRQFQRRNAISELCYGDRRLIVQIVTDLKRDAYVQQLCE